MDSDRCPMPPQVPTTEKHVFDVFLMEITTGTNSIVDTPDLSMFEVDEVVIKYPLDKDLVPMKDQSATCFSLEVNPGSYSKLNILASIQFNEIGPRYRHQ